MARGSSSRYPEEPARRYEPPARGARDPEESRGLVRAGDRIGAVRAFEFVSAGFAGIVFERVVLEVRNDQ